MNKRTNEQTTNSATDYLDYVDDMVNEMENPCGQARLRTPTGLRQNTETVEVENKEDQVPRLVIDTTDFHKRRIKAAAALAGVSIRDFVLASLLPEEFPLPKKKSGKTARVSIEVPPDTHHKIKNMALQSGGTVKQMVHKKLGL